MRIYMDTQTGTWGDPDAIRIVDLPDDMLEEFSEMNDNHRIQYVFENFNSIVQTPS